MTATQFNCRKQKKNNFCHTDGWKIYQEELMNTIRTHEAEKNVRYNNVKFTIILSILGCFPNFLFKFVASVNFSESLS